MKEDQRVYKTRKHNPKVFRNLIFVRRKIALGLLDFYKPTTTPGSHQQAIGEAMVAQV